MSSSSLFNPMRVAILLVLIFAPISSFSAIATISLPLPLHSFPRGREANLWRQTPIPIEQIERRIFSDLRLRNPQRNYVAAINALQAILHFSEDRFSLLPKPEISESLTLVDTNSDTSIGNWSLVSNPLSAITEISDIGCRRAWQLYLESAYNQSPTHLEWELLRLWQLAIREIEMPSQTNRRNEAIAAALNAWHQTYDPLARVIPISLVEEFLGGSIPPSFADKLRQLNPRILSSPQTSRVGLIKLSNFLENSGALEHAVRQLENSTALIVDLRNNPGSTIEEARNILNIFLDDRSGGSVLFFTSDSRSNQVNEAYRATRRAITNKPLVVLIDATTKSVAELVAGVLQQTRRAWIIGDISFGKGTYVEPTQIPGSEALLYESKKILRYANGGSPQEVGVTPDFRVNSDVQTPRLIDLYVNVLPFQTPHFVQTRAADIQRINECVRCLERQSPQTIVEVGGLTEDATLQRALLVVECQQPRQNPPRTCR